jgi:hypothetical protein
VVEFGVVYPYNGMFVRPLADGCYEYADAEEGPWEMRCACEGECGA